MSNPYHNAGVDAVRQAALSGNQQASQELRSRGMTVVEGQVVNINDENAARSYAREARRAGLNPSTGLRPGLRANVPLTGTYKGIRLPRGGIDAADPNPEWLKRLKQKNPELYDRLTSPDVKVTALKQLEKQNPVLFKRLQKQADTTAYGAEQGIYGPGGYEKWRSNWDNAFVKAGMTPVSPQEWSKLIGGTEVPKWFTAQEKKDIQRQYGNVSWFAGSNPFDYLPSTEEGTLRVMNRVYGTDYGSMGEMRDALGPALMWNQINVERQRQADAAGGAGPLFRGGVPDYLRTGQLIGAGPNSRGIIDQGTLNSIWAGLAGNPGGTIKNAQQALQAAQQNMPGWFDQTFRSLQQRGFPEESMWTNLSSFLGRPGMNITDPSKPLFRGGSDEITSSELISAGGLPSQLADFGNNSAGLLKSLTAQEFLEQMYPLWQQYYSSTPDPNDPLNSIATYPEVRRRGLNPLMINNQGERGVLYDTPAYQRWSALGYPGGAGQDRGRMIREPIGGGVLYNEGVRRIDYDPLRGNFDAYLKPGQAELSPNMRYALETGVRDFDPRFLAAYTGIPNDYWDRLNPEVRQYAPYNLDPATLARMMAIIGG